MAKAGRKRLLGKLLPNGVDDLPTINLFLHESIFCLRRDQSERSATAQGVLSKSLLLVMTSFLAAAGFWEIVHRNIEGNRIRYGLGWWFIASPFIVASCLRLISLRPASAVIIGPIAALALGVFYGFLTGIAGMGVFGVTAVHAMGATFFAFAGILLAFKFGLAKVNSRFLRAWLALASALMCFSLADGILSVLFLEYRSILFTSTIESSIVIGGIFLLVCGTLLIDLSVIQDHLDREAPSHLEWYLGISILFDLVWMYVAVLLIFARIAKIRR